MPPFCKFCVVFNSHCRDKIFQQRMLFVDFIHGESRKHYQFGSSLPINEKVNIYSEYCNKNDKWQKYPPNFKTIDTVFFNSQKAVTLGVPLKPSYSTNISFVVTSLELHSRSFVASLGVLKSIWIDYACCFSKFELNLFWAHMN